MMHGNANRLRDAFASRSLDRLIDLMDPDVTWRGMHKPGLPVPHCHDRDEVRAVMTNAMERGVDGTPVILAEAGDSVVVDPGVEPSRRRHLHQVITFRAGRIVLMQDYPNRKSAMAAVQ
jgi:ketosteroid isomerase-like protein